MSDKQTDLHPKNNTTINLKPNIVGNNIPDKAVTTAKLSSDLQDTITQHSAMIENFSSQQSYVDMTAPQVHYFANWRNGVSVTIKTVSGNNFSGGNLRVVDVEGHTGWWSISASYGNSRTVTFGGTSLTADIDYLYIDNITDLTEPIVVINNDELLNEEISKNSNDISALNDSLSTYPLGQFIEFSDTKSYGWNKETNIPNYTTDKNRKSYKIDITELSGRIIVKGFGNQQYVLTSEGARLVNTTGSTWSPYVTYDSVNSTLTFDIESIKTGLTDARYIYLSVDKTSGNVDFEKVYVPDWLDTEKIVSNAIYQWCGLEEYYVSNIQQRLYFDEVARFEGGYFVVSGVPAGKGVTYTSRYVQFDCTEDTDFTLSISYYKNDFLVESHDVIIHVRVEDIPPKKIILIGDSLTNAKGFASYLKQNNNNLTLYGTRQTDGYRHEGRYSWSSSNYLHDASYNGLSNPFYNPSSGTFDFSYYINNNPSYSDVDIVNIFLGRNDGYDSTELIPNLDKMISSIKAYNNNIIVTVFGAYDVAYDNSGAGRFMQNNDRFNYLSNQYNQRIIRHFKDTAYNKVYLIMASMNLDDVYDYETEEVDVSNVDTTKVSLYTNNVHPKESGYAKLDIAYASYLKYILAIQ